MNEIIASILSIFEQSPTVVFAQVMALGAWLIFFAMLFKVGLIMLAIYKAGKYTKDWKHIVLAIDVPPMNVQTPLAVEQFFSHIFSVMNVPDIGAVYKEGFVQESFSLEIISIEGYLQFLIRTRDKFRDVVEAAIYAQYPEAEITEVEDYTKNMPRKFPSDTHKMWASDFTLTQHWAFPIRLYREFEHNISKDTVLKDPMGTFLESFSRIGPGEQMWFQIMIEPTPEKKWKGDAIKEIKKMIGEKASSGGGAISKIVGGVTEIPKNLVTEMTNQMTGGEGGFDAASAADSGGKEPPNNLLYMTPGQKKLVEAMEDKISKIGFKTKIRAVYIAQKEVYNPSRGVNSLVGAINQYNNPFSNTILPKYMTSVRYFGEKMRSNYRKTLLMGAYKDRNMYVGKDPFIMNIEELATIWHFPMSHVKTPLLQKAQTKAAEPPAGLPVEGIAGLGMSPPGHEPIAPEGEPEAQPGQPPQQTYQTDSGEVGYGDPVQFG